MKSLFARVIVALVAASSHVLAAEGPGKVHDDMHSFVATSHWTSLPVYIVHSYPHVKLGSPLLPLPFHDISSLRVGVEWGMTLGSASEAVSNLTIDSASLTKSATVGNVAFDIWADLDPVKASNESHARIEIMIWLGSFGTIQPLGWDNKTTRARAKLGEHTFTLYVGEGPAGQSAFTWIPDANYTRFDQDLSPLVQYLWKNNLVSPEAYVGTVGFGSEQFFSLNPVAFSSERLALNITTSGPLPDLTCNAATGSFRPPSLLGFAVLFMPLFIFSLL
ncbi:hypothetical protein OQA88_8985 [Cercophora sp. LCS_1]